MSDNQDNNNQDSNNNQQSQPSKLPRPKSLDHCFNKIQSNPKLIQFQAKLKPVLNDKNTKFSYKTSQNQLYGNNWLYNSRLKFQAKEGKTKLSISTKMLQKKDQRDDRYFKKRQNQFENKQKEDGSWNKKNDQPKNYPIFKQKKSSMKEQKQPRNDKNQDNNSSNSKSNNNDSGNLDISLSTAFVNITQTQDNSKINLRLKDKGQINIKFNQMIDLIPNTLKTQLEYLYEYKNKVDINKYSIQFLYTTGLNKFIEEVMYQPAIKSKLQNNPNASNQTSSSILVPSILQKKYIFHKNQTKIKTKITNHSDTEIKLNSINHFGQLKQAPLEYISNGIVENSLKGQFKDNVIVGKKLINQAIQTLKNTTDDNQDDQKPQKVSKDPNQILKLKLQLQNKLNISSKSSQEFNFKTSLNCQSVPHKQSIKFQTIVNQNGFHNFQTRYLCRSIPSYIFGGLFAINWNSHHSAWHKKWQLLLEKQKVFNIGTLGLSVNDKCLGFKFIKKFGKFYKVQLTSSRKWQGGSNNWGNIGVKININW